MTDKEKIAKFMHFDFRKQTKWIDNEDKPLSIDGRYRKIEVVLDEKDLEYDKSWDWLMPVVEKIKNIYNKKRGNKPIEPFEMRKLKIFNTGIFMPLKYVYGAVVEFIDWYETQKT